MKDVHLLWFSLFSVCFRAKLLTTLFIRENLKQSKVSNIKQAPEPWDTDEFAQGATQSELSRRGERTCRLILKGNAFIFFFKLCFCFTLIVFMNIGSQEHPTRIYQYYSRKTIQTKYSV